MEKYRPTGQRIEDTVTGSLLQAKQHGTRSTGRARRTKKIKTYLEAGYSHRISDTEIPVKERKGRGALHLT
jgi:hypothetical protein